MASSNLECPNLVKILDSLGLRNYLCTNRLFTVPFLRNKLTPYETVTSRPSSTGTQLSVNPLSSHANMTSYFKSLMSYDKVYHQQVKEAFQDPNSKDPSSHSLEPGDWVFWKHHQRKTLLEPHSKRSYQVTRKMTMPQN